MNVLIIGGSAFLGRALVDSALREGHSVSVFNRGLTHTPKHPDVERIVGNRLTDLSRARNHRWDAIIDTCAYSSKSVDLVARNLSDITDAYTFISSISAYKSFEQENVTEDLPVWDVFLTEENIEDESSYGQRKALCESATRRWFRENSTIIRLGMLIGPHDNIPRFSYWLRRIAAGGYVVVPGRINRWIQLIDVRDAANFIVRATSQRQFDTFNVTGPLYGTSMGTMFEACRRVSESDAEPVCVPDNYLARMGFTPQTIPYWVSERFPGVFTVSAAKAERLGLRYRPLEETVSSTWRWLEKGLYYEQPDDSARTMIACLREVGPSPDQEREIVQAWKKGCGAGATASFPSDMDQAYSDASQCANEIRVGDVDKSCSTSTHSHISSS